MRSGPRADIKTCQAYDLVCYLTEIMRGWNTVVTSLKFHERLTRVKRVLCCRDN